MDVFGTRAERAAIFCPSEHLIHFHDASMNTLHEWAVSNGRPRYPALAEDDAADPFHRTPLGYASVPRLAIRQNRNFLQLRYFRL